MADDSKDTQLPLLMSELSVAKKAVLEHITHHAGFAVLTELFEAACTRATNDTLKIDFEKPGSDHILSVRTQRARNFHECVNMVRESVNYHTQLIKQQAVTEEDEAVAVVARRFGIHKVPTKQKEEPKQAE